MPSLLVIGDIAWDILIHPHGDVAWGSDVHGRVELLPGGSSANVAVWARRLGATVTLVGRLGDDLLGELMMRHLHAQGLRTRIARTPGGRTTRVGILVRPDGEHAFVTDHTTALRFEPTDVPIDLLDTVDAVFLNGYSIYMSGSAAFVQVLLSEARRRGVQVGFDPSSSALLGTYGTDRLLAELGPLDLLLANEAEAQVLAEGKPITSLCQHARLVVAKKGASGADAYDGTATFTAPSVPTTVVDTTGAGDAFDAAFLVTYLRTGRVDEALAAGNRLGSFVTGHLGAQPSPAALRW